jgi:hypothetical protein
MNKHYKIVRENLTKRFILRMTETVTTFVIGQHIRVIEPAWSRIMKTTRTLCEVSLIVLLLAGVGVFVASPTHLDGQDANSQFPDVNDLLARRAALASDGDDFSKMIQSLGTSSPTFWSESDILNYANTGTEMTGSAIWFLRLYESMQCEPDRITAKGALKNRLGFYSHVLEVEAGLIPDRLAYEKSPAMTQAGFRIRDDLRAARDKMDEISASLK